MKYVSFLILSGMLFTSRVSGQEIMTFEEAVTLALDRNYGIQISIGEAEIVDNNAHPGAAGLLPTVSANGSYTYNNNATQVEFSTPSIPSVDETGVVNTNINASITASYRLFDGGIGRNTLRILNQNSTLSQVQTEGVIEAAISQIANLYYSIARLKESARTLAQSTEISRERYERAQNQQSFGAANKLAVLNAEVDLNTDSANLVVTEVNLENSKRSLNALLGREISTDFDVETTLELARDLVLESLLTSALQNNSTLKLATYSQEIAAMNVTIAKAAYIPTVDVTAGYSYLKLDNGPGNILASQQNIGLSLGASVAIPIFSGNQRKVAILNAERDIENTRLAKEEQELNLIRDLSNTYYTYQSTLEQLQFEQKSLEAAEENFTRTEESFKLGQATNLQFREAQINLQRVRDRLNDLGYTAKLSEIEIFRLSGMLLGEN
ncbi:MAG: TolC family protein [Bacteroidota bacterium]